jgi:hypothetical protein
MKRANMILRTRFALGVFILGAGLWTSRSLAQQKTDPNAATKADGKVKGHKRGKPSEYFQTSDRCLACHNGLTSPTGEDISIGFSWRPTMMANSARDPYWQAGVRRETIDHPMAKAAIEDECSICHMPAMRYEAKLAGHEGEIFAHLPFNTDKREDRLAADGVTCSVCHQITPERLGTRASFVGGFKIDESNTSPERTVYGPYEIDKGHTRIMRTSTEGYKPTEGKHIRQSEVCATCHTLLTQALDAQGKVIGELPEQVPYQEWLHSEYKETKSCQACHMPVVKEPTPITSILGEPREGFSRHTFVGGNFFMQRILNRFRDELGVTAPRPEFEAAANRTVEHLQSEAAKISVSSVQVANGRVQAEISVENLGGHKLPTAYPSRRVWLHVTVKDANGRAVFESGALNPQGSIQGNDNDADATKFEPHYTEITSPDQVQIYESVMAGADNLPTTGLLTALRFVKDNRLLPHGFNKQTADKDVAVHGNAEQDPDFTAGGDKIRYNVTVGNAQGPFIVEAELWYQPLAYRWAENLKKYDAFEPRRFTGYYDKMAGGTGVVLGKVTAAAR